MRFLFRTVLLTAGCLWAAAANASMPSAISLTIHGDFDAGTSGGTASNTPTLSTLSIGSATLLYDNSDVQMVLLPGEKLALSLGSLTAAAGDVVPVSFTGASIALTIEINEPPAAPTIAVIPLSITGSIGVGGETLTLAPATGQNDVEFLTTLCVPKIVSLSADLSTTVTSGGPPVDIGGLLSIVYGLPFDPGDVDGDGSVTLIDAVQALRVAGGLDEGQCEEIERGDITGSGTLDLVNIVTIARKAFGM